MKGLTCTLFFMFLIAVLGLAGCAQPSGKTAQKVAPAKIEKIEETGLNRVVLTEKAAERLNIQTRPVIVEPTERQRVAWGEVVAPSDQQAVTPNTARVFVSLNASDTNKIDRSSAAFVKLMDDDEDDDGMEAELDDVEDGQEIDDEEALYYLVDNTDNKLVLGQRVRLLLPLQGGGTQRFVVPYSALIYDLNGKTWVYVSPEPLVFTRYPVVVDYIEEDEAYLLEGPPAGTQVATVGVPELYGADTGVGK